MAGKKGKKRQPSSRYALLHKFKAFVAIVACCVVVYSGWQSQVSLTTILIRATVVILCISLVAVVIIRAVAAYEELNSGKG